MLLALILIAVITFSIVLHVKRRRLYKLAANFNGPPTIPFIGNALKCLLPITEMPDALLNGAKYYKTPVRFWIGPYLFIGIWNPNDIKTVYNNPHCLHKLPYLYKMFEILVGKGLITLPVEEWKLHRRLITPTFNQRNLESYFDILCDHAEKLVDKLKNEVGNDNFDVDDYLTESVLNLILDSLLGYKSNENTSNNVRVMMQSFKDILLGIMAKVSNIFYISDFIFSMSPTGKKFNKAMNDFHHCIDLIIDNWKESLIKNHTVNKELNIVPDSTKPRNFVEHLLLTTDEEGKLTAEELHDEVMTVIVAGLETTGSMLGFLLIVLGMHPDIQESVYQEIMQVLGTEKQLQLQDLNNLLLLDRVIKESLRVFPASAGTGRYCTREITLENHTIPANTNIVIGLLNLHRDPVIWPNPTKFDPDRFLPEEEAKRHPYSWIPFSAGPRNCIGSKFAMMIFKMIAVKILINYRVKTAYNSIDDVRLSMLMVLKPTDGYKISITAR